MSFVNVVDSLNRLSSLVNNLRHNQNLLIDFITESSIPPPIPPRPFSNIPPSVFSAMSGQSGPNVARSEPVRTFRPRHRMERQLPRMHPEENRTTSGTENRTETETENRTETGIRNMPPNVEVSFIDSRNSDLHGSLNTIFNNIFGESPDSENENQTLSFSDIIDNTELLLYKNLEQNTETNTETTTETTTVNEMCSICRETITDDSIIRKINNCNHYFHHKCLDNWLRTKNTCPNCRQKIVEETNETNQPGSNQPRSNQPGSNQPVFSRTTIPVNMSMPMNMPYNI